MAKTIRLQPNRLRHVRGLVESGAELNENQRATVLAVLDKQLEDGKPGNALAEFHHWIRQGDSILTSLSQELDALRAVTSPEGDSISRAAVYLILQKYWNHKPKNEVDEGVNWVLNKIKEEIETLSGAKLEKENDNDARSK